jgi:hypothetical protein
MTSHTDCRAFQPRQLTSRTRSTNPKTVRNRNAEVAKRGLDAAFLKVDVAFRTAKSRAFAKLHDSKEWKSMSDRERSQAERNVERVLKDRRDRKKQDMEKEWRYMIEEGLVEPDEDVMEDIQMTGGMQEIDEENVERMNKRQRLDLQDEVVVTDDSNDDWEDCEGQEDWERIGTDLLDIQAKFARRHHLLMRKMDAHARRAENEYERFRSTRRLEAHIGS